MDAAFEHPAIDHLGAMPEILRWLMTGVSDDQAYSKPGPGRFSIAELLEHLSHVEAHYFRENLDRITGPGAQPFLPYDQDEYFAEGRYSGRDAEESFAHWEEQREQNLVLLQDLSPAKLDRSARHPELGPITLRVLLNEWAMHDLGHVRQMAELVRAQLYYGELGPFQPQYTVKP